MSNASGPQYIEVEADSVEEAIQQGLDELGLTRAEVTVEVLDEGARGLFGVGGRAVRVRLTEGDVPYQELAAPDEPAAPPPVEEVQALPDQPIEPEPLPPQATEVQPDSDEEVRVAGDVLRELLEKMGIEASISVRRAEPSGDEKDAPWVLDVRGEDLGILIGRRGETLNALQYVTRLIVSREMQRRVNIVIDIEGYKSRREVTLRKLAQRMAQEARHRGRAVKLEPMPPNERRIIHITLRDDPSVFTESEGMGDRRKVTIIPAHSDG
jgi:spoIIIJ-associated protein